MTEVVTVSEDDIKPRKPLVAVLLTLFMPGLGQFYNGQLRKAILFYISATLPALIFGLARWILFRQIIVLSFIEITIFVFIIIDAINNAKSKKQFTLKVYNRWYYYLLILSTDFIVFGNGIETVLGLQTFKIPTVSNEPTLLEGDRVVADLRAYRKRGPEYGDCVIFQDTEDNFRTYRTVGLPGDKLDIIDDIVTINGKPSKETFIGEQGKVELPQEFSIKLIYKKFVEELQNGHRHEIFKIFPVGIKNPAKRKDTTIFVPENNYFLMGDNRDNALDCRFIGPVKKEAILGRLVYIFWSKKRKEFNINLLDK